MALLSSCTESGELEQVAPTPETEGGIHITMNLSMGDESSRISTTGSNDDDSWSFTWDEADESGNVYAYCRVGEADSYTYSCAELTADITDGDVVATFSGTLPAETDSYRVVYKADGAAFGDITSPTNITADQATMDLTTQDGSFDNLMMISDLIAITEELPSELSPKLYHLGGFLTFKIPFANIPESWSDVKVEKVVISGLTSYCEKFNSNDTDNAYWSSAEAYEFWNNGTSPQKKDITLTLDTPQSVATDGISVRVNYLNSTILNGSTEAERSLSAKVYFTNGTYAISSKVGSTANSVEFERAMFYEEEFACDLTTPDYPFADDFAFSSDHTEYTISTEEHLKNLAHYANSGQVKDGGYTFTLLNDVTLTSDSWDPIGYSADNCFGGVFDGDGHSITKSDDSNGGKAYAIGNDGKFISAGLFGYVSGAGAMVKNLTINNFDITLARSGSHTGILVGTLSAGATLLNCGCDANSSAEITASGAVGGLAGYAKESKILNCYNQGAIKGEASSGTINIGGIVGSTSNGSGSTINNCYNSGKIEVSATTSNAGSILGGGNSGNKYSYLYYLDTSSSYAAANTTSVGNMIKKNDTDMKDTDFVYLLNHYSGSANPTDYKTWMVRANNYPTF